MKRITILTILVCFLLLTGTRVAGQVKPASGSFLLGFKALVGTIDATFTYPEGFIEIKPPNNNKLLFQYGLKLPDEDIEMWFQVNPVKNEWQTYEKEGNKGINPDSLYIKTANEQATLMAGAGNYFIRTMPPFLLQPYNADAGKSYFFNLLDMPQTNHYQYGLLITLQKHHMGNITVLCLGNDKGPAFFRGLRKLQGCFKFNS